jgi:hypothetical protein
MTGQVADPAILAGFSPEDQGKIQALTDVAEVVGRQAMCNALRDYLYKPFSTADELHSLRAQEEGSGITIQNNDWLRRRALEAAAGVSGYNRGILYRLPQPTGIVQARLGLDEHYQDARRELQAKPYDRDLFMRVKVHQLAALAIAPLLTPAEKQATMYRWRLRTTKLEVRS